ncbi:hypothetical protein LEN26_003094 [Aphanomyces euteiches]|nr:hypothetical protein AeMF1_012370 [Aphanomyces euteiches]KAH9158264.1 hypothetical protein LEN26_003094 [Aphanomyces euteiches]
MPGKRPLPLDFFNNPRLSRDTIKRYVDLGKQSAETLIHKAKLRGGAYDWKLHKDESELKIYKQANGGAGPPRYCGVMQVVGTLDEYIDLYRYDTTKQAREYYRRFGGSYVDVALLHTVLPRHPDRPNDSTHIKWCMFKGPLDGLVARRDFVVLETDFEFKVDGKRAWVRSCRSIELAGFPDTRKSLHCLRGSMHDMGQVVVESDRPGYLDMTHVADMDMKGAVPSWAIELTFKSWLRSMAEIDRFMRENRLSRSPSLGSSQLTPLDSRSACALCRHKFGLLRKKSNCFKCGDVVCRACNRTWNVKIHGDEFQLQACLSCSLTSTDVVAPWTPRDDSPQPTKTPVEFPLILTMIPERMLLKEEDAVDDDDVVVAVDYSQGIVS